MRIRHILYSTLAAAAALGAVSACKQRKSNSSLMSGGESAGAQGDTASFLEGCGKQDQVGADRVVSAELYAKSLFISDAAIEECIYQDLTSLTDDSLFSNVRYLTLTHFYNSGASAEDINFYRASISKAINSLSSTTEIVRPQMVDPLGTIVRINLLDYGWEKDLPASAQMPATNRWDLVFAKTDLTFTGEDDFTAERGPTFAVHPAYPYFRDDLTKYHEVDSVQRLTRKSLRYIYGRADWFVARATIPPLYHAILEMPVSDTLLEEKVLGSKTTSEENIQRGLVSRSGFNSSGVSSNNRLLERHKGRFAGSYYWKSYDFANSVDTSNFLMNPFGPCFKNVGKPLPLAPQLSSAALFKTCAELDGKDEAFNANKVFRQGGGEMIYSLPNGLQAYFLVNNTGKRLSIGPANIVADLSNPVDKFEVLNGRSCMFCHYQGMIDGKEDELGPTIRKLAENDAYWDNRINKKEMQLFVDKAHQADLKDGRFVARIAKTYDLDRATYLKAERLTVGPDVPVPNDPPERAKLFKAFRDRLAAQGERYVEAVNFMNDRYQAPVDARVAAAEFGLTEADMKKRITDGGITDGNVKPLLDKLARGTGAKTLTRGAFEAKFVQMKRSLMAGAYDAGKEASGMAGFVCKRDSAVRTEYQWTPTGPTGTGIGVLSSASDSCMTENDCKAALAKARGNVICSCDGQGYAPFSVLNGKKFDDPNDKCGPPSFEPSDAAVSWGKSQKAG